MAQAERNEPGLSLWEIRLLRGLLGLALILFLIGVSTPMLTLTQLVFIRSSFSVVSGVYELFRNDQYLLFLLIGMFSLLLPMFKLWVIFRILMQPDGHSAEIRRYLHWMHDFGRWSMLDVLVVAVLVVTVKLGAIASVQVHFGLPVFGLAVLLIMFITQRVVKLAGG
jgi:paraquat-inducible protein A